MPTLRRRLRLARTNWLILLLPALLLAACRPASPPPGDLPGAASEPAGAVRQLADHLQRNDLVAFARDAVPPAEHAQLVQAWADGRSRWPLTELPLDEQLGPLLTTLAMPDSEQELRRTFDRQLSGQDAALRDAARSLALFGTQYVKRRDGYSAEERAHYQQIVAALGAWSATAPLGDRTRGHAAIDRLAAAARTTGLEGGDTALAVAGMEDSLRRLGPFAAAAKAVLADYGLDLDRSLADLRSGLIEEDGDRATVRIHYPLAGTEIDTVVSLTRRDGRWYLTDYLEHAAALLAEPPPTPEAADAPAVPDLPEPPPAAAAPAGPATGR